MSASTTKPRGRPLIIAHRGASTLAPENTLAAFKRAIDCGADGIELDVRLARDGVPVVIHDATLKRTGLRNGTVAHMTSAQLATVDVGTSFNRTHSEFAGDEFSRERIPTLAQVFQLLSRDSRSIIYVEIKSGRDKASRKELCSSVAYLIDRYEMRSRAVVVSFELDVIANVKSIDASFRTGALFAPKQLVALKTYRNVIAAALDNGADEILLHRLVARARVVRRANDCGLPVVVWTVDDPDWPRSQASFDIRALITNNPALFTRHTGDKPNRR